MNKPDYTEYVIQSRFFTEKTEWKDFYTYYTGTNISSSLEKTSDELVFYRKKYINSRKFRIVKRVHTFEDTVVEE